MQGAPPTTNTTIIIIIINNFIIVTSTNIIVTIVNRQPTVVQERYVSGPGGVYSMHCATGCVYNLLVCAGSKNAPQAVVHSANVFSRTWNPGVHWKLDVLFIP